MGKQELVHLSGKNRILNEISIKSTRQGEGEKKNVVLCAGYGAGLGFYFRNFDGLTDKLVNRMDFYAVDWLGELVFALNDNRCLMDSRYGLVITT